MEDMAWVTSSPQICLCERSYIVINPNFNSEMYKHLKMVKLICKTVLHSN